MISVEYAFYTGEFKGKTNGGDFDRLSVHAAAYLDRLTSGRIHDGLPADTRTNAKFAFCAVLDALLLNEQGGGLASESNDGISVNYLAGVSTAKTEDQRLSAAASLFLGGTGLLYRGVP